MAAPHSPLLPDPPELRAAKRAARDMAMRARADCDPAVGRQMGEHVLARVTIPTGAAVAGFWPLPGEIDLRPLLHALHARGCRVGLPVTPPRGHGLSFRAWTPATPLVSGRFGTVHPQTEEAIHPDILLVPLLAFDRCGFRLGYGGGYYDRTLAALPGTTTIGCAFAAQQVDSVPVGPYDIPMAYIATEQDLISCAQTGP